MVKFFLSLLVVTAITGCGGDRIVHPLIEKTDAKPANELFGAYTYVDEEQNRFFLHVGKAGSGFPENFFRVVTIFGIGDSGLGIHAFSYVGFLSEIKGSKIVHIAILENDKPENNGSVAWENLPIIGYRVAMIEGTDLGFSLKGLNHEFIKQRIRDKILNGSDTTRDSVFGYLTINMPTAEIRNFFETNMDAVFDEARLQVFRVALPVAK